MRSFLTSFSTFALFHFLQSPLACLSAMASRNPAASHDVRQHRGSYDPLSLSPMAKVGLDGDEVTELLPVFTTTIRRRSTMPSKPMPIIPISIRANTMDKAEQYVYERRKSREVVLEEAEVNEHKKKEQEYEALVAISRRRRSLATVQQHAFQKLPNRDAVEERGAQSSANTSSITANNNKHHHHQQQQQHQQQHGAHTQPYMQVNHQFVYHHPQTFSLPVSGGSHHHHQQPQHHHGNVEAASNEPNSERVQTPYDSEPSTPRYGRRMTLV